MPNPPKLYLYKRGYRYYIGYFAGHRKRWKSTGATQKTEALKALTEFRRFLSEKRPLLTLAHFTADFLSYATENYSQRSFAFYKRTLAQFQGVVGDIVLTSITARHVDLYKTERMKKVSPVSVNIELRMLRAAFYTALRWKLVETNPFSKLQLARVPDQPPCFFTKQDFQKLFSIMKEAWLREVVVFAVLTGMRKGEIINLRWKDIDLDRRLINIQSNSTFKTKQGKRRVIPLSDVAYHLLQVKHGKNTSEYAFTLSDRKISDGWLSHKFKYYVYEAKLDNDKLHFHSLRHTFASWLVQDGVNIYEVQKLLGHSSVKVTEVYSHLAASELRSAVNRISLPLN
jgi:site-specific recombinase XerD